MQQVELQVRQLADPLFEPGRGEELPADVDHQPALGIAGAIDGHARRERPALHQREHGPAAVEQARRLRSDDGQNTARLGARIPRCHEPGRLRRTPRPPRPQPTPFVIGARTRGPKPAARTRASARDAPRPTTTRAARRGFHSPLAARPLRDGRHRERPRVGRLRLVAHDREHPGRQERDHHRGDHHHPELAPHDRQDDRALARPRPAARPPGRPPARARPAPSARWPAAAARPRTPRRPAAARTASTGRRGRTRSAPARPRPPPAPTAATWPARRSSQANRRAARPATTASHPRRPAIALNRQHGGGERIRRKLRARHFVAERYKKVIEPPRVLRSYLPAIVFVGLGTIVGAIFVAMNAWFGPKRKRTPTTYKEDPYECGLPVRGPAGLPLRDQLLPDRDAVHPVRHRGRLPLPGRRAAAGVRDLRPGRDGVFIALLVVAFVYVWRRGALEWR